MDDKIGNSTGKMVAKRDSEEKRQSTFFLTDKALESLKSCMEMIEAPSINHALEFLLLELGNEVAQEKPTASVGNNQKIVEQAKLIDERYSKFITKSKSNRKKEEIELFTSLSELQKIIQVCEEDK